VIIERSIIEGWIIVWVIMERRIIDGIIIVWSMIQCFLNFCLKTDKRRTHSLASLNQNLTALAVNSFSKFNGVKLNRQQLVKNFSPLSVNGLKITSVRCPLNVNELKFL
jgi:hypothetical protein